MEDFDVRYVDAGPLLSHNNNTKFRLEQSDFGSMFLDDTQPGNWVRALFRAGALIGTQQADKISRT
jgi:hypothetical protein